MYEIGYSGGMSFTAVINTITKTSDQLFDDLQRSVDNLTLGNSIQQLWDIKSICLIQSVKLHVSEDQFEIYVAKEYSNLNARTSLHRSKTQPLGAGMIGKSMNSVGIFQAVDRHASRLNDTENDLNVFKARKSAKLGGHLRQGSLGSVKSRSVSDASQTHTNTTTTTTTNTNTKTRTEQLGQQSIWADIQTRAAANSVGSVSRSRGAPLYYNSIPKNNNAQQTPEIELHAMLPQSSPKMSGATVSSLNVSDLNAAGLLKEPNANVSNNNDNNGDIQIIGSNINLNPNNLATTNVKINLNSDGGAALTAATGHEMTPSRLLGQAVVSELARRMEQKLLGGPMQAPSSQMNSNMTDIEIIDGKTQKSKRSKRGRTRKHDTSSRKHSSRNRRRRKKSTRSSKHKNSKRNKRKKSKRKRSKRKRKDKIAPAATAAEGQGYVPEDDIGHDDEIAPAANDVDKEIIISDDEEKDGQSLSDESTSSSGDLSTSRSYSSESYSSDSRSRSSRSRSKHDLNRNVSKPKKGLSFKE